MANSGKYHTTWINNAVWKHPSPRMWRNYYDVFSVMHIFSKIVTKFWICIERTCRHHNNRIKPFTSSIAKLLKNLSTLAKFNQDKEMTWISIVYHRKKAPIRSCQHLQGPCHKRLQLFISGHLDRQLWSVWSLTILSSARNCSLEQATFKEASSS